MVKLETPMGLFLPNLRSSSVKSLGWSSPDESQSSESLPPFGPLPPFLDRSAICLLNPGNHCTSHSICKSSVWSSSRCGPGVVFVICKISHCTSWYFDNFLWESFDKLKATKPGLSVQVSLAHLTGEKRHRRKSRECRTNVDYKRKKARQNSKLMYSCVFYLAVFAFLTTSDISR